MITDNMIEERGEEFLPHLNDGCGKQKGTEHRILYRILCSVPCFIVVFEEGILD
jgi:hypothetical protein